MSKSSSSSSSSSSTCCRTISIRIEFLILIFLLVTMSILLEYPMKPSFKTDTNNNKNNCPIVTTISKTEDDTTNKFVEETKSPESNTNTNNNCDCQKHCKQQKEDISNNNQEDVTEEPKTKPNKKPININSIDIGNSPGSFNLVSLFDTEKEANSILFQRNDIKDPSSFNSLEQLKQDAISQLKEFFPPSFNEEEGDKLLQLFLQLSEHSAQDHRRYSKFTRTLKTVTTLSRMSFIRDASNFGSAPSTSSSLNEENEKNTNNNNNNNKTKVVSFQMFRFHSSSAVEDDNALTVPSIPTDLPNLEIVAPTNFGLVAGFFYPTTEPILKSNKKREKDAFINSLSSPSPSSSDSKPKIPTLKVATVLTGHMRSYKRCAERLTKMVLGPTDSSLFIATYQDRGEKRYGKREQISNDDIMNWFEVEKAYAPYLKGLFVGEVPLLRRRLEVVFPKAFTNTQFSWMLYQFLLIEIGLNMTEAAWRGWDFSAETVGEMSFGSVSTTSTVRNNFNSMMKTSSMIASEVIFGHSGNNNVNKNSANSNIMTKNDVSNGVWPWIHFWKNCGKQDSKDGECSLIRLLQKKRSIQQQVQSQQEKSRPYDIFIRLRPDLFIIGTIKLSTIRLFDEGPLLMTTTATATKVASSDDSDQNSPPSSSNKNNNNNDGGDESTTASSSSVSSSSPLKGEFQLSLDCGEEARTARNYPNRNFLADMDDNVILVTPHHPVYEWILDKVSDLSQVATYTAAKKFLPMYSFLSQLNQQQQDSVFVPLCTAERLWNSRAKLLKMHQNKTFGWFAMLRNASTFKMGANEGASSERRRQLVRKIFAITNPDDIACPMEGGLMITMPPHSPGSKSGGKKKK